MGKRKRIAKKAAKAGATRGEHRESGLTCAYLCHWACSAFGMEPTAENMRTVYATAWTRARECGAVEEFAEHPTWRPDDMGEQRKRTNPATG